MSKIFINHLFFSLVHERIEGTLFYKILLIDMFDISARFISWFSKYPEENWPVILFASGLHKQVGANRI
jgi:hypothetical protein